MESRNEQLNRIAPRRIRVQAALWVTELHGPGRDSALEARVRRWLNDDPRHAAAFELATDAWQRSGNLPQNLALAPRVPVTSQPRSKISARSLAGISVLCLLLITAGYFLRNDSLSTGPSEQRTVELADGTLITLNANSKVVIQYDDRVRKVTLDRGEVLFDVTKHQNRPFVVVTGDRKVIAMGTSFVVRREDPIGSSFEVTLVEGRVAVEPVAWSNTLPSSAIAGLTLLAPGERLRFAAHTTATKDSPPIERVTAWRHGELIFDDTSLAEAAAEFNRYGTARIRFDDAAIGRLRVGGVFRIGDPASFAQSMANAHRLRIISRGKDIVLSEMQTEGN